MPPTTSPSYDNIGNAATFSDSVLGQVRSFAYDHRDRLVHACTASPVPPSPCDATLGGGYDETDQYDPLGNLTSKGGIAAAGR